MKSENRSIFLIWLLVAAVLYFGLLAMELNGCATRTADVATEAGATSEADDRSEEDEDGDSDDDASGDESDRPDRDDDHSGESDDGRGSEEGEGGSGATVEEVIAAVAVLRGLAPVNEIEVSYLDRDELQDVIEEEFLKEYSAEEVEAEAAALKALDLIPERLDLLETMQDLLTDQVVGFYDDTTKELALISDEAELDIMNEVTLSHEATHALQDQYFNLAALYPLEGPYSGDANLARLALVEGDASLAMTAYVESELSLGDMLRLGLTAGGESFSMGAMPSYLEESLAFPYFEGESFAAYLHDEGGWELVNGAYSFPPLSTEHILHPQKYLAGEPPVPVDIPDLLPSAGAGWEQVYEGSFGEFDVRQLLSESLSSSDAAEAAAGWGGGQYKYYERSDGAMMAVMLLNWDDRDEADEFVSAMQEYLEWTYCYDFEFPKRQFPILESCDGDYWVMVQSGRDVMVARVPDRTLANVLPGVVLGVSPPAPDVRDDMPPGSVLTSLLPLGD